MLLLRLVSLPRLEREVVRVRTCCCCLYCSCCCMWRCCCTGQEGLDALKASRVAALQDTVRSLGLPIDTLSDSS